MSILFVTSYYSLLRGVHSPTRLVAAAAALGWKSVALVDRDNLYGLPEMLSACAESGLRPVIGAELTEGKRGVLLLAEGDAGFANLCRVITARHRDPGFRLLDAIRQEPAGLKLLGTGQQELCGLRECMPVWFRQTSTARPPAWVRQSGIPCLIAPPAVFLDKADWEVHRYLRAIDGNTTLARLDKGDLLTAAALLDSWASLRDRFAVFEESLAATEAFAASIRSRTDFGAPIMPRLKSDTPSLQTLRERAYAGALRRYGEVSAAVARRLDYELDMIGRKGFAAYFLVVEDIVAQSPRTCGRGSGAASLVAYCLQITNVDPLRHNLMFERFINPGRKDPPDIDVDFAWDERDAVLDYVFRTYGEDHAAMVATHQTLGPRMALRETARIWGMTEAEIGLVTKKLPWFFQSDDDGGIALSEVLATHPRLQDVALDPPWPAIVAMAQRLMGIPRGIGTHCGGVVITPGPLWRHVPLQRSAKGYPLIQWEKDGAEQMGLVKIDLLGNRSLAVIRDALDDVRAQGVRIDEARWDPASDPATIELLARGQSMGVFYVESPAMRLLQQKAGRGDFEHLVIHSSIIRPAANSFIGEYVRRLHGGAWQPEHPLLAEVLKETFGIMVYQEDVARVVMALADFSFEEADQLRKIMSRKSRRAKLQDFRERFCRRAGRRGVSQAAIERIWAMCLSFSGYSFCKPHSASYCQVSFQSAWLKAHHPAAFLAAVMSNYGGFYSTQAYVSEAQRLGLRLLPPDVNASRIRFCGRGRMIRVGLCQIKGLSLRAQQAIVALRSSQGPYRSLQDLVQRCGLEEADAERLILAGACDGLEPTLSRPQLFWRMATLYRSGRDEPVPELKEFTPRQLLAAEYRLLGFLTAMHPITLLVRPPVAGVLKIEGLGRRVGRNVRFWGWCVTSKTVLTSRGESMQFVTFEDETGLAEAVFFPAAYRRFVRLLARHEAFLVSGTVTAELGAWVVEVQHLAPAVGRQKAVERSRN